MEHSRIPMRGKTKDAEAEALLKLLRQEQEFHSRQISIPQIQRKQPLPSIRGTAHDSDEHCDDSANNGVFISQMKTGLSNQDICFSESQFLCSNSKDSPYNNNDNTIGGYSDIPSLRLKSYDWKKDTDHVLYHRYERQQRKPTKNLPPLGPQVSSPRERDTRPSRPLPSSPKLWEDD
ncbi:uncharacterized protein LOC110231670 [Exaiptasia diaphana]|uniref:Uncharacterized protein n=1 Tax=Exaiptasia diaphana TaxID=2652724 RepID=A0A913WQ31_EXADI|nr:uncharacterized protein LOC110231670 [Exaiptasia diaphana]